MDLLEKLRQKRAQVNDLKAKIDDINVEINRIEGQIVFIKELIEEDGGEEVEELRAATEEDELREPEDEEEIYGGEEEAVPEDYESPFENDVEDCPVVDSEEAESLEPVEAVREPEQLDLEL